MQMIIKAKTAAMLITGLRKTIRFYLVSIGIILFFNIYEQCLSKALPVSTCKTDINNAVPT